MLGRMQGVGHISGRYVRFRDPPPRELAIARVAERQHNLIHLTQLRALGLSADAVRKRAAQGRLHRIYQGVYAVGHGRLGREGHWLAAVLAYGPSAVLSHRSATALWNVRGDSRAKIDVSVPGRSARSRPGIDIHRSVTLSPADVTTLDGIPCTTLARTLLDLAEVVDRRGLERAIEQAEVLRLFDLRAVEEVLIRANGRRGASVLRAVLADLQGPALTDTELEERFLALCRAASLPSPRVNEWLDIDDRPAIKADFLWRRQRLVIETDGWASHGTRQAFERDRFRDERLKLAGYESLRFTQRRIVNDPGGVLRTVRELLARREAAAAR
jgi:very-short-patch-repair endonuclease/predicted transcriptional regulator of viral defense system